MQLNSKAFSIKPLKKGDVIEVAPTPIQSASLQLNSYAINTATSSSSSNINLSSSFSNNMNSTQAEEHTNPILLQITEDSLKDDVAMDTIRLDPAAGQSPFNIARYSNVNVKLVNKQVSRNVTENKIDSYKKVININIIEGGYT